VSPKPTTPYRLQPPAPPEGCSRCGDAIADPTSAYEGHGGARICRSCFVGQYDLLALFGVGAITAGAITGSGALLVCGLLVPSLGAWAIYRGGV